jgi:hypothetical protein
MVISRDWSSLWGKTGLVTSDMRDTYSSLLRYTAVLLREDEVDNEDLRIVSKGTIIERKYTRCRLYLEQTPIDLGIMA